MGLNAARLCSLAQAVFSVSSSSVSGWVGLCRMVRVSIAMFPPALVCSSSAGSVSARRRVWILLLHVGQAHTLPQFMRPVAKACPLACILMWTSGDRAMPQNLSRERAGCGPRSWLSVCGFAMYAMERARARRFHRSLLDSVCSVVVVTPEVVGVWRRSGLGLLGR